MWIIRMQNFASFFFSHKKKMQNLEKEQENEKGERERLHRYRNHVWNSSNEKFAYLVSKSKGKKKRKGKERGGNVNNKDSLACCPAPSSCV
jgi:hypothetical protein